VGRVEVTDTGVGLTPSDMALLFQPFSQVGDQAVKTQQGTGLGLYLAKGIVERHDGRIWAESPGPGRGSTFGFEVPLAVEPPPTVEIVSSTPAQSP
jgi:signal transduction histidine kinase